MAVLAVVRLAAALARVPLVCDVFLTSFVRDSILKFLFTINTQPRLRIKSCPFELVFVVGFACGSQPR